MLLQRLVEYADRLEERDELAPPLYSKKWVRYVIDLDGSGRLLNPQPFDLSEAEQGSRRGQRRAAPNVVRASAVKPLLLADNAEYTLGLGRETSRPERVEKCHAAYMELLEACAAQTKESTVIAVLTFLQGEPQAQLHLDEDFDRGEPIIFRVDQQFVHLRPPVKKFWVAHNTPQPADSEGPGHCLVCGEEKPIVKRLKGKIKGVPGGHSVGTAIISANKPAFESYGLQASQIAPTCVECGDRFTKALNHLLRDDSSHVWSSSLAFAFWTPEPVGFNWASFLQDPDTEAVRELFEAPRSGKWDPTVDETAFYAVSLSGSGGRTVIRDWIDATVGQVKASLVAWFQGQEVVDAWGEEPRPLGVWALAGATVRDLKDISPPTLRGLLRTALTHTPLPWNLLQQAVRRNHAERTVTRPRAALIKLVMRTQGVLKENEMVQLQPDHPEAAYHCGRLLAVLESIQRSALGDINATIVDRFYGTASTAPASVFGRLVGGAQPHLSKLRRDRPGAGHALQQRLEEVLSALPAFPHTLDLKQQGLFALGYYHQRAHDRAQARARTQNKAEAEIE
ncbi:MAG: type I-C CRISPR-associated protein Cas8c/Csd1 [Chloroflexota bacterium]